jgi:hypothetical protein
MPGLGRDEWWPADLAARLRMSPDALRRWVRVDWVHARKLSDPRNRWTVWADPEGLDRLERLWDVLGIGRIGRGAPSGQSPNGVRISEIDVSPADRDGGVAVSRAFPGWKLGRHYGLQKETVHNLLKSDCRAERSRLRMGERLTNLLAVLCVVAWRVFWVSMTSGATTEAPAEAARRRLRSRFWTTLAGRASRTRSRKRPTTSWRSRSWVATWRA